MVVDVLPIRVCCHYKGVLALGKAHSQFVAHLVSLLCADLTGSEGLPYLISNYIAFLPASVHKVVLPLGKHKLFICRQGAAGIAADILSLLGLVWVFDIVRAIFQAGRNGHAFVFVQRNQPCCCQCHHLLQKMPHIGGIKIIWIISRDRQHLPDTWLPAEHFPIRC